MSLVGAEELFEILRADGSRAEAAVPPELQEVSDCAEMRLQSAFIEAKPHPCLVLVHKVELDASRAGSTPTCVVKYTPERHSPALSDNVKLGTARYYRGYGGEAPGIRDEREARYVESLRSTLEEWNPDALTGDWWRFVTDGSVTYQGDGSWFYCAALPPRSPPEPAAMEQEFGADCMTDLGEPAGFARELGSAFAQKLPAPPVTLDEWFHLLQDRWLRSQSNFERVVHVHHGHVVYSDDYEELVKPVPFQHRARVFPFVKRSGYAHQREYRFTVSTIGKAAQDELLVPVTDQLRDLVTVVT